MTTDGERNDRGKDRTEAAFDALSSPPGKSSPVEPDPGNPWKPAALLLLLMALVLPLAFGIRASRVRIEFEGRVAEAAERAAEVRRLAEAGDLTGAIAAMAEVTDALADVEGVPAATGAVREVAERRIADLQAEQRRVAERDARFDRNRRVVDALLAGDPKDASRLIGGARDPGALEEGLERLSLRLDALCMAYSVEGEARIAALELLATAWKLPVVSAERARAADQVRRARESAGHLRLARAARDNGDVDGARTSLDLACQAMGVPGMREEFDRLRVAELKAAGQRFETAGDHAGAAVCYELAGNRGLAEAERGRAATELEAARRQYLIDRLEQRLAAAPDHRTRAAIAWMLAEITGDSGRRAEAAVHGANDLLALARNFRAQGELDVARALAAAAKTAEGADAFRAGVTAELARNAAAERLKQADSVLTLGGPAYAAWLVGQNDEQPAEVMRRIRAARRAQAVTQARALFDQGDLSGARDALEGQPADDPEVRDLHRRLILATDDGSFGVELPKDRKEAEALVHRAVLDRFRTDPAAAGRILATYEKSPAGIVPSLAAFLDAADQAEGRVIWQAVRAEVEKRFTPAPEKPVEPKKPVPDEVE